MESSSPAGSSPSRPPKAGFDVRDLVLVHTALLPRLNNMQRYVRSALDDGAGAPESSNDREASSDAFFMQPASEVQTPGAPGEPGSSGEASSDAFKVSASAIQALVRAQQGEIVEAFKDRTKRLRSMQQQLRGVQRKWSKIGQLLHLVERSKVMK
ncbi:hypothetical protein L227DRAFT_617508 [Lentinus tigrinus ALCF2SS1-6]|uniref:Uncharacterized protein n=1 Tax=Lentinus tigrinus ALCF2SS1-6 TaxID=1328759 RepID=A0A5C2RMT3_9APHY|nr:hypothetical protein L227DRAFT_617508 [Lentinus tigrinus ALCF2SS1-6]